MTDPTSAEIEAAARAEADEREALLATVRGIFNDPKYGHDPGWLRINVLGAISSSQPAPRTVSAEQVDRAARVLWDQAETKPGRVAYSWDYLTERAATGKGDYPEVRDWWLDIARRTLTAALGITMEEPRG